MVALLTAVRDRIRAIGGPSGAAYTANQCDMQDDGKPNPASGEIYVSVWSGGFRNQDLTGQSLDELYAVNVTITVKTGREPEDGWGPNIVAKASTGLLARAERIRAIIAMDPAAYAVLAAANAIIGAGANGFIEPLRFGGCSVVESKGADWFGAQAREGAPPAGLAVDLTFVNCRRIQNITDQT